ncbi:MAG: VTT domain-containing protein [Thermodesulfobacteriota bacterium]
MAEKKMSSLLPRLTLINAAYDRPLTPWWSQEQDRGSSRGPEREPRAALLPGRRVSVNSMRYPINYTVAVIILVVSASSLGIMAYHYWQPLCAGVRQVIHWCPDKEQIRIWVESWGPLAPLAFILIQALQVVAAPIPGEVTGFLSGFLFGVIPGFLYSTLGLTLGGTLAFLIGRWLEVHLIEKWVKKETLEKFDYLIEREGALVAFLLFLIPWAPKDYLCFLLGLSKMPLKVFLLLMAVGRMPATFLLTLQGAQVYQGNYLLSLLLLILALSLGGVLLANRERFYRWLRNWGGTSPE